MVWLACLCLFECRRGCPEVDIHPQLGYFMLEEGCDLHFGSSYVQKYMDLPSCPDDIPFYLDACRRWEPCTVPFSLIS
jgi:hypothetical protein